MIEGSSVTAAERITEEGYRGQELFVHAELGDRGVVVDDVGAGWQVVRWSRNDSIAQCHDDEITSA